MKFLVRDVCTVQKMAEVKSLSTMEEFIVVLTKPKPKPQHHAQISAIVAMMPATMLAAEDTAEDIVRGRMNICGTCPDDYIVERLPIDALRALLDPDRRVDVIVD